MPTNLVMPTSAPKRFRDERGFLLVEVLVSAMLLLVASLAIMTVLDKADGLAGNQQKRTLAANVAQSELERVRSLPIEDVANLRKGGSGKSTVTLNGVNFTVNSESRWLTDGKDTVDCTADNGGLDYLRVSTEVSWPSMGNAKPAKLTTIVTPSNRSSSEGNGSLSVAIVNAAGKGIPNVPVTLTGPESYTEQTDENGCVAWGDLDASATWNLKFKIAGYVDINGNSDVDDTIALAGGTTTVRQYQYDKAGYVKAMFTTRTSATSGDVPVFMEDVSLVNSSMSSGKVVKFSKADNWDGSVSPVTPLFPFSASSYTVYAGQCDSAKPPASSIPVQVPNVVNVSPGIPQGVFVRVPSLRLKVQNTSGQPVAGATVKVTDACGNSYIRGLTDANGALPGDQSGFPYFASGKVCASAGGKSGTITTANNDFSGAALPKGITLNSGTAC